MTDSFYNCSNLKSISLAGVTCIGSDSFRNCISLTSITIASDIIESTPFRYCDNLTIYTNKASKPSGWDGGWNFDEAPVIWGCELSYDNAYVVSFTKNASSIDNRYGQSINAPHRPGYVFDGWATEPGGVPVYSSANVSSALNGTTLYAVWFNGTQGLQFTPINGGVAYAVSKGTATDANVVIPAYYNGKPVVSVGGFANYYNMTSITIPSSVSYIGQNAFDSCSSLTTVVFEPNSALSEIGYGAFADCENLLSIMISGNIALEWSVFVNCYNLTLYTDAENPYNWFCFWEYPDDMAVWGCVFSGDGSYVVSIDPRNRINWDTLNAPHRGGYTFMGWTLASDWTESNYTVDYNMNNLANANSTLYAIWIEV